MTPAEAAELLAHCAAFDRRTIGEADARAWARALHDVPLDDDTRGAIADHYGHTDKWITAAQVREMRARIRTRRIDSAHPVYDGNPNETGKQFIANRQAQLTAAAEGALPVRTISQAVGAAPQPELLALLPSVVRPVDEDEPAPPYVPPAVREHLPSARATLPALGVDCPNEKCRAGVGRNCKSSRGVELRDNVHGRRRDAWAVRTVDCPECHAPARQPCPAHEPHPARIRATLPDPEGHRAA